MKNNETLSIVICTHNRVDFLRGAIQSILEQDYPVKDYELIVVDNNSSDSTRTVVEEFTSQHAHVRYILETNIGLSNARNRGWQEARGEYVGYVDDDCKAPPEWLVVARDVINQIAPAAFGGPYFAFYNTLKPRWYRDEYGAMDLGAQAHVLDPNEYMSGGNLFFRRAVLEVLGGFDPALGMSDQRIAYGEETALLRRMRTEMPDQMIYYEPRLYVYHLVAARKMTWRWILRMTWSSGQYSCRVFENWHGRAERYPWLFRVLRQIIALGGGLVYGVFLRDRQMYPYFKNYLYERVMPHLSALGALYEQAR